MAFDVYVGTLTRYYAEDWENVAQRDSRERGTNYVLVHAGRPKDFELPTVEEIAADVEDWRTHLAEALDVALDWAEGLEPPYFTDRPSWDGFAALQLLAAYTDLDIARRWLPPLATEDNWQESTQWQEASSKRESRFHQIYYPELWLPVDIEWPFEAVAVAGKETGMGSSTQLLEALNELNDRTYQMAEDVRMWSLQHPPARDSAFEVTARYALSLFIDLAGRSVEHGLPMLLDY